MGRLALSQTSLFGKFARTQLRPLYQIFHRMVFSARLPHCEKSVCGRRGVIAEFTPRAAIHRPRRPHWFIYTDSATAPPMLCDLLFRGNRSFHDLHSACAARAPAIWPYFFRNTALIYGLVLLALVLFFEDQSAALRGTFCWM